MLNRKLSLAVAILCLILSNGFVIGQTPVSIPFSFSLSTGAKTSAGVYKKDSTLVRTLWSGVDYSAGTHTSTWDGKLDDLKTIAPKDSYIVKVTSNNITATWEGVVGNNGSTFDVGNSSENSVYHPYLFPYDMSVAGSRVYVCSDYNETQASVYSFDVSDPGTKIFTMAGGYGQVTQRLCNDGERLYMGGELNGRTYIQAASFANLTNYSAYMPFQGVEIEQQRYKVCDIVKTAARITGMDVQTNGNLLFVAREFDNNIHVLDKISGTVIQILSFGAPTMIKIDAAGFLWLSHNHGTVEKFIINSNGTLTTTGVVITGFESIQGLSCNGTTVAIASAPEAKAHQVKGYSTSNGALLWTLGQNVSYGTDATVENDKFCFKDRRTTVNGYPNFDQYASIAFEADGSLWVNDRTNSRLQHFDNKRIFDKHLAFLGHSYHTQVDPNNPTRVFSGYLEYKVDYSKPLMPGNVNGAWQLVNNWSYNVSEAKVGHLLKYVTTIPQNGRTYALEYSGIRGQYELAELVNGGALRYTGVMVPMFDNYQFCKDGSLVGYNARNERNMHVWHWSKATITGFDGLNNPIFSSFSSIASIDEDGTNVVPFGTGRNSPGEITSSNIIPVFRNDIADGYHLAGLPLGGTKPKWQTAKPVVTSIHEPFPNNGDYDIFPGTQYAGNTALASDNIIIWGYNGEFWHGAGHQTNFWNIVSDKGLFLRQFGTSDYSNPMAGNAFSPALVKVNGIHYLYLNDESVHGGIHRWKIDGLNTIHEEDVPVTNSTAVATPVIPSTNTAMPVFAKPVFIYTEGNSLTAGYNAKGHDGSDAVHGVFDTGKDDWPNQLRNDIAAQGVSSRYNILNASTSGESTIDLINQVNGIKYWFGNGSDYQHGLISVWEYTNHLVNVGPVTEDEVYDAMVKYCGMARGFGVKVFLGNIIQRTKMLGGSYNTPALFADVKRRINARLELDYRRFADKFVNIDSLNLPVNDGMADGVHLSTKGYGLVKNAFKAKFVEYLNSGITDYSATSDLVPFAPKIIIDNIAQTMAAVHSRLPGSEILFSKNNGDYQQYTGPIDLSNIPFEPGYYKFKTKAAKDRAESPVEPSPGYLDFTAITTPSAPNLKQDIAARVLIATHPLGESEILVCENEGPYLPYKGQINVGNVSRPAGFWKFKIKSAPNRNESNVVSSPEFIYIITPDAPTIVANNDAKTLIASHPLGISEIVVSENGGPFTTYDGQINVGNVTRASGYWKFKIKAATNRNESAIANSPAFTATITPDAPAVVGDDVANTLSASHSLGYSEILVSENGGSFTTYDGQINVGNVARSSGYWKFKIKAATNRNESAVANSPAFTVTITPDAPAIIGDDVANTLSASHSLGNSEILVSENSGPFTTYDGQINVGNVARSSGYWKFKIKAATNRNESAVANSPAFTATITPDAPAVVGDDVANTLSASHSLGNSEILVSENGGPFTTYDGQINVGNVARAAGYWKFKIKAATNRNESAVANSPAFTVTITPDAPAVIGDDVANTLSVSHSLGNSEILVSENGGPFTTYDGQINVGNVARAAGHWKFKIKAATNRNESAVANSPAFTVTITPDAPAVIGDDVANTLSVSHSLGNSEILVSENGGPFTTYDGQINVGNVARTAGHWKFKIKAATNRNESAIANSPAFTVTITPDAPAVIGDDVTNILSVSHSLGNSEILVSQNGGPFTTYDGQINVGNVARAAGYWKFKIKAATNRNESAVANSPAFTVTVTPDAPTLFGDNIANLLTASHTLGNAEIVVSENGAPFVPYAGRITVGDVARPVGYWKFKIKAAPQRNESEVANSPAFAATLTPEAPTVVGDNLVNSLTASHALGSSEILVSENGGLFIPYAGQINVGDIARPAGYWKFKTKAALKRNESGISLSPEFTMTVTPDAPTLSVSSTSNTLSASHPFGNSEILVSVNNGPYNAYVGSIFVGNVARPVGYWKFKVKAAQKRNESAIANSPQFTITTTVIAPTASFVLPAQLSEIKATQIGKEILVQWRATTETNVDRYEVEKSNDGRDFKFLGSVRPKSGITSDYNFTDTKPFTIENHYRIKTIDKSGETRYSKVVFIKFINLTEGLHVYPNPILNGTITIQSINTAAGEYHVSLTTNTGQIVLRKSIHHTGGALSNTIAISSSLAKGVYNLYIQGKDLNYTKQLIK